MKTHLFAPMAFLILLTASTQAAPLATAFTYQGRLADGSNATAGIYDSRFALFDSAAGGIQLGGVVSTNGDARWLEIAVRNNGSPNPLLHSHAASSSRRCQRPFRPRRRRAFSVCWGSQ